MVSVDSVAYVGWLDRMPWKGGQTDAIYNDFEKALNFNKVAYPTKDQYLNYIRIKSTK